MNKIAISEGLEDIQDFRQDTTVVETNIHYPTNILETGINFPKS